MDEFIKKIILGRTIQAAFQRGKVYRYGLNQKQKEWLKNSIKEELEKISSKYINEVSEKEHLENIKSLSTTITKKHNNLLKNGCLRIGTSQKLLNVYIKFLWCLGEAKEPKHCPIDSIVLREIKLNNKYKWTDIKSIKEYKEIMSKIHKHTHDATVAEWEKDLWNIKANNSFQQTVIGQEPGAPDTKLGKSRHSSRR